MSYGNESKPKSIRVAALWTNKRPDGTIINLSGSLGGIKIKVWPAKVKKHDKSPDWSVEFEELPPKNDRGGGGGDPF